MTDILSPFVFGLERSIPQSSQLSTKEAFDLSGGNTGNFAFHEAIYRQLSVHRSVPWSAPASEINSAGDIAVIPAANQIGPHADFAGFAKKFEEINVSSMAIGLGAQTDLQGNVPDVPRGTLDWIKSIVEHRPRAHANISVRGEFSARVLEHYGFSGTYEVLGCPSLFLSTESRLGAVIADKAREPIKRIAVCGGHPNWAKLKTLEQSLARLITASEGCYVSQSNLEMLEFTRGRPELLDPITLRKMRDYLAPELEVGQLLTWARRFGAVFFDINHWMEFYRRFDLVIGARIHGVMIALQAGIPGVCVVHDGRTLELCKKMLVPYILASDYENGVARADLSRLLDFDWSNFDANRLELCRQYSIFLQKNGLSSSHHLNKIIGV